METIKQCFLKTVWLSRFETKVFFNTMAGYQWQWFYQQDVLGNVMLAPFF